MAHSDAGQAQGMLRPLADAANLVTLGNVAVGFAAMLAIAAGDLPLALLLMFWAVYLDHLDGWLARRQRPRNEPARQLGGQLDSFADLINFGVVPAGFAVALSAGGPAGIAAALAILLASVVRLAWFNVHGLEGGAFRGLPTTFAAFLIGLGLCLHFLAGSTLAPLVLLLVSALAVAEVSPFSLRKLAYPLWFPLVAVAAPSALVLAIRAGWLP